MFEKKPHKCPFFRHLGLLMLEVGCSGAFVPRNLDWRRRGAGTGPNGMDQDLQMEPSDRSKRIKKKAVY